MTYSDAAREWLKWWECPSARPLLSPHWDAIGKVWDIGFGHVFVQGEERRDIAEDEAEQLLDFDLYVFDLGVSHLVTVAVEQYQYDAMVLCAYNIGIGAKGFGGSTLLRRVNEGDFPAAAAEFPKWNKAGGNVVAGLSKRRAAERAIFERADYSGRP